MELEASLERNVQTARRSGCRAHGRSRGRRAARGRFVAGEWHRISADAVLYISTRQELPDRLARRCGEVRRLLQRHARARRVSAALSIRSVVPVRRPHLARYRQDDQGGARSYERRRDVLTTSARNIKRRIESHAQDRSRREINFITLRRRYRAAAANQNSRQRTAHAAENAADDRANTGAGSNAGCVGLALERPCYSRPN